MIPFLQDLVLKDFWLKLFSFALAVLAWFTVDVALRNNPTVPIGPLSFAPAQTRTEHLPVTVMSSAEDVRSVRVHPKEVDVTIQGDGKVLDRLQSKDIRVICDLTGIEATNALRRRIEVTTPAGVTHVKVDPEEVQVIFPPKT
jgi:YbbR domain-containing protein